MTNKKATGYGLQATARKRIGHGLRAEAGKLIGGFSGCGLWPVACGRWLLGIAAVSLLSAGCSSGSFFESDIPAPTRYVIASLPAAAATSSAVSQVDLSIGRPDVAPGLDTERVAVLRGRELDYYRGAQWSGRVVEVVQTFLINSLQDQQLFRSVTAEQARVSGDYLLDAEVRDFQAEYVDGKAAPQARVTVIGRVIRIADRSMIDTITATATQPATQNRMTAVAAAFETAAQQVAQQMSQQAAASIAKDREENR